MPTAHLQHETVTSAINAALRRGAKFLVDDAGNITIRNANRISAVDRDTLRINRDESRRQILEREQAIRDATPQLCESCGNELARWHNGGLFVAGHHFGWGIDGWAWMGHAIVDFTCRQCDTKWTPDYPPATGYTLYRPDRG